MAQEYRMEELLDADLYATRNVQLYKVNPYAPGAKPFATIAAGNLVGYLYSWVTGPKGEIAWMFKPRYDLTSKYGVNYYYAKHNSGAFRVPAGVKTWEQKMKEADEAAKGWEEKLGDAALKLGGTLLSWGIVAWAAIQLLKSSNRN